MRGRMWGAFVAMLMIMMLVIVATPVLAQVESTGTGSDAADTSGNAAVEANEEYDLDIDEKHIELGSLNAGLVLKYGDGERLSLSVGAEISAEDVDIWLRNVQGHVVFRGTLQPLLERIGRGGEPAGSGR